MFGRFEMHDLVRDYLYKLGLDMTEEERVWAREQLFDYYEEVATSASRFLARSRFTRARTPVFTGAMPEIRDRPQATAWYAADRDNLVACLDVLTDRPDRQVQLAAGAAPYLRHTGPWDLVIRLQSRAVTAARTIGDREHTYRATLELAVAQRNHGDYDDALATLSTLPEDADSLCERGIVHMLLGEYEAAEKAHATALEYGRAVGELYPVAIALHELGVLRYLQDRYDLAVELLSEAKTVYEQGGHRGRTCRSAQGSRQRLLLHGQVRRGDRCTTAGARAR